jgi:ABC-2 type transport system permease protein
MIRTSLTAVPRRGLYFAAKALTGALLASAVAVVTVLATFAAAQAGLGPHRTSRFARPYGPWTGIGIMALWTATALLAGYLAVCRRDT